MSTTCSYEFVALGGNQTGPPVKPYPIERRMLTAKAISSRNDVARETDGKIRGGKTDRNTKRNSSFLPQKSREAGHKMLSKRRLGLGVF